MRILIGAAVLAILGASPPQGKGFTDVTQESGLGEGIARPRPGSCTEVEKNARARPGLRVHLQGPADNPQAVGAVVRLVYRGGEQGPAREIRLGGGYWSQDSCDLVLGLKEEVEALEIRWPGGAVERVSVPAGTRTISRTVPREAGHR